jgi:hypothetical protein
MAGSPVRARQSVIAGFINVSNEAMRHEGAFYFGRRLALVFRGLGGGVSNSRFTTSSNGMGFCATVLRGFVRFTDIRLAWIRLHQMTDGTHGRTQ